MNRQWPRLPDPLQRTVPKPYLLSVQGAAGTIQVESNDLEIALALRELGRSGDDAETSRVISWIILRDYKADSMLDDITLFASGTMTTLLVGRKSVLVFDREFHKIIGFIDRSIEVQYLVAALIPMLVQAYPPDLCSLLQTSDKRNIAQ